MDRYVYVQGEITEDVKRLAAELSLGVMTNTPSTHHVITDFPEYGCSVIAVPSIREFNSASVRHFLSGHTVFISDDFGCPNKYIVTYTSPRGCKESGLLVRSEENHAVFYGELGEVGTWTLDIRADNGDLLFSQQIEATDELRAY